MPPKKEPCRNFQRGSCQYGERCKFLHVTQQQTKPNAYGFGMQTGSQFQHSNSQQQKPNPFGFGVQTNSQPRAANDFSSKQNQFKPFENKWTRSSPSNNDSSKVSRQPDNQNPANHKCTDAEACKRQILEDLENERPIWKLTCYSHSRSSTCDIVGDISCEELRAAAYDDAKRGLGVQSIVERERGLVNSKLHEFESLRRNPYAVPTNSATPTQNSFPGASPTLPSTIAQNNTPSVSSFSQLGASSNNGFGMSPSTQTNNGFGQSSPFQTSGQNSSAFGQNNTAFGQSNTAFGQSNTAFGQSNTAFGQSNTAFGQSNKAFGQSNTAFGQSNTAFGQSNTAFGQNNNAFGNSGSFGSQPPTQSVAAPFPSNTAGFGSIATSTGKSPFSSLAVSPQIPNQALPFPNGPGFASNGVTQSKPNLSNMPKENDSVDNAIWLKEVWTLGEIPEEAPPDNYIF